MAKEEPTTTTEQPTEKPSLTKETEKVEEKATEKPEVAKEEKPEVKPKEGKEAEVPPPKTILEEEHQRLVDSLKAGHKGTVDKMRTDLVETRRQMQDLQIKSEENELAAWLKVAADSGIDEGVAKQFAERERQSRQNRQELDKLLVENKEKEILLNEAARTKTAYDLLKTYELGDDTLAGLLDSKNPEEMEVKALRLHIEKLKASAQPAETVDKAQTRQTKGVDLTNVPAIRRLGMAIEGEI